MNLQLDKKNLSCMVLSVSGPIRQQDARILRLGFRKLLAQARQTFLIDLSDAIVEKNAEISILELQLEALNGKIRLVIFGPYPKVCQAPKLADAQALLGSVVKLDKILVPQLQELFRSYEHRMLEANSILESPDPQNQFSFVKGENIRLKNQVADLEVRVNSLLREHVAPLDISALTKEKAEVETKIAAAIDSIGVPAAVK